MYGDKNRIYTNARNFVRNYVEQRGEVTTKELSKLLKQQFSFNSNQVSGLLNKMSTSEKSITRIRRGVYGPYRDNKYENNRNLKYIKTIDSFRDELAEFINHNMGDIKADEFREIQRLYVSLDEFQKIISTHSQS